MDQQAFQSAHAEYLETVDYDAGAGDVTKAERHLAACRRLLALMPLTSTMSGSTVSMSVSSIESGLKRAERWLAQKRRASADGSGPGVRKFAFRGERFLDGSHE